jgi:hypothetical protein
LLIWIAPLGGRAPLLLAPRTRHRNRKLPRPDGRTLQVKRYHELIRDFTADIGAPLSSLDEALLGQAAALIVKAELIQTAIVSGQDADVDDAVRLASESRRILEGIKAKSAKAKPPAPTIHDLLAELDDDVTEVEA